MKISLQIKFLIVCLLLVFLTTTGLSITYYYLTKHKTQQGSQRQLSVAFRIMLDDLARQMTSAPQDIENFVAPNETLQQALAAYAQDPSRINSISFLSSNLFKAAHELKSLSQVLGAQRVLLYAVDRRLLAVVQADQIGLYVADRDGQARYLAVNDPAELTQILLGRRAFPETAVPSDVPTAYSEPFPEQAVTTLFTTEQRLGVKITVPIRSQQAFSGVLVAEVFYTQATLARYAALSGTEMNLFVAGQLSVGTLAAQTTIAPESDAVTCETLNANPQALQMALVTVAAQRYYQGQCVLTAQQHPLAVLTASISTRSGQQQLREILTVVLIVSGIAIVAAFGLSWLLGRNTIRSIREILRVMSTVAEGVLQTSVTRIANDEIGLIGQRLNQMIAQLRSLSIQIHDASHEVSDTAGAVLHEIRILNDHMEQQSTSVDNTTDFVEHINEFTLSIRENTASLLTSAEKSLLSSHGIRESIENVTQSTGHLATNVQHISASIEQVNRSIQDIAENGNELVQIVRRTETEIHHIDDSLQGVSANADRAQQLAKETMHAVQNGQVAVEASMQGMLKLKAGMSQSARLTQEVNSSVEQISSILDLVDDITEQTSLLALNASIISAQSGVHGKGFAVVANEIKDLATRTKTSMKAISALIRTLQTNTNNSVQSIQEGLANADRVAKLADAVQESLTSVLASATRSSNMATDTARVVQQTSASSQIINTSMDSVADMVSQIQTAIQEEEQDIAQIVSAIENIRAMSQQVNSANIDQNQASEQIVLSMESITAKLSLISGQAQELQAGSSQILTAMHAIEFVTQQVLQDSLDISGDTANNIVKQADHLHTIVSIFKI